MPKGSYKKYGRIKKKKSIFYNRFFWLVILAVIVIIAMFYLLFFSPVFQIKDIQVIGKTSFVEKEAVGVFITGLIPARFLLTTSENIFVVKRAKLISAALKQFPEVRQFKIQKKLPSTLIIEVFERIPVANFYIGEGCYFVDEEGVIFKKSDAEMLVLKTEDNSAGIGKRIVEEDLFKKVLGTIRKLEDTLSVSTKECLVTDLKIELITENRGTLIFDPQKDLDEQIDNLKLILEKEISQEDLNNIDHIDLRYDKIFYEVK